MKAYQVRSSKIGATHFTDINKRARLVYREVEKRTKRRPYIRSAYFKKEKIFFDYFWPHLNQAPLADRRRRLRFLPCAIELIEKSHFSPTSKQNPNKKSELLHRFAGITTEGEIFFVQVKENLKTKQKFLMSIFPPE